jgi:hypothetical protein
MSEAETALMERAWRAYERGRVVRGLQTAALVVPMALVSWIACRSPLLTVLTSAALVALVVAAVWRGRELARGARLGLRAGAVPLVCPIVAGLGGHVCAASFCLLFPTVCLAGGLAAGAALGVLARSSGLRPLGLATAALVAALTGSLGCLVAGSIGIAALAGGLAFGLAPALSLRRA